MAEPPNRAENPVPGSGFSRQSHSLTGNCKCNILETTVNQQKTDYSINCATMTSQCSISFGKAVAIFTVILSDCCASTEYLHVARHNYSSRFHSSRTISAFGDPKYFSDQYISSDKPGVKIKVPNFDVLFEVSTLPKDGNSENLEQQPTFLHSHAETVGYLQSVASCKASS